MPLGPHKEVPGLVKRSREGETMQETLLWFPVEEVPGEVVGPGLLGQVDSGLEKEGRKNPLITVVRQEGGRVGP